MVSWPVLVFKESTTFKKMERIVGPIVEKKPRESCERACALEQDLTISATLSTFSPVDDSHADDVPADNSNTDGTHEYDPSMDTHVTFDEAMSLIEDEDEADFPFKTPQPSHRLDTPMSTDIARMKTCTESDRNDCENYGHVEYKSAQGKDFVAENAQTAVTVSQ